MNGKKIKSVIANWHQTGDNESGFGEQYDLYEVGKGKDKVLKITEFYPPKNQSRNRVCVFVYHESGDISEVYNINHILWQKEE